MELARSLGLAVLAAAVLWLALDSRILTPEPAPESTVYAIGALALVFGTGSWVMYNGGQPQRATIPLGMALGLGGWVVLHLLGV
jgi:Co/Zn/Cd efflux system component